MNDTTHETDPAAEPDTVEATPVDATTGTAAAVPVRRSSAWLAWTIAVAFAVVAAFALVQWRGVVGPADAVDAASDTAVTYVRTLSNWDASSGLEPTYAALVTGATDDFVPQVDDVFGSQTREELVQIEAVSTGTIEDVLTGDLEAGDPDSVQVVVVVEQFVVTGPTADPLTRTERVALLRMVRADGGWLVDDLQMLSELQLAEEDLG